MIIDNKQIHYLKLITNKIIQQPRESKIWPEGIIISWGENAEFRKNIYGGILKYGSQTDKQLGWFKNLHR